MNCVEKKKPNIYRYNKCIELYHVLSEYVLLKIVIFNNFLNKCSYKFEKILKKVHGLNIVVYPKSI